MRIDIQISETPLDIIRCIEWASSTSCGGIDVFIGNVRANTGGKTVLRLEFEAYERMALLEMRQIAQQAFDRWPVEAVAIHHRTGVLTAGETAVIIAVSAAHRAAAFDACRYAIDTLKQTVPIWKKEVFEDGEVWVAAHP
jgi:molybdopterin synthase catalytic subunit